MDKTQKVEFIESYIKIGNGDYQWHDNHGELVRCKDCKFSEFTGCKKYKIPHGGEWYCADGTRR